MSDLAAADPAFLLHILDEWKRDQRVPVLTAMSLERALGGSVTRPECEHILARLCDDGLLVQAWSKHRQER